MHNDKDLVGKYMKSICIGAVEKDKTQNRDKDKVRISLHCACGAGVEGDKTQNRDKDKVRVSPQVLGWGGCGEVQNSEQGQRQDSDLLAFVCVRCWSVCPSEGERQEQGLPVCWFLGPA